MQDNEDSLQNEIILKFICPVCKAEKKLTFSKSIINESKTLTTISIQRNEICEHHFQAFVDKNFRVRGYQKVDFELVSNNVFPEGEFFLKVIVIGDCQVGKTAIINRFIDNHFEQYYVPTIQLKISKKNLNIGQTKINFVIWDIGGQVTYMSPYRNSFYNGAQSGIIVIDRTREKSLEDVEMWYKDSYKAIPTKIPFILVGNKSDLEDDIVIYEQDLKAEAKKLGLDYMMASAKTGENVQDLFSNLTQMYFEAY